MDKTVKVPTSSKKWANTVNQRGRKAARIKKVHTDRGNPVKGQSRHKQVGIHNYVLFVAGRKVRGWVRLHESDYFENLIEESTMEGIRDVKSRHIKTGKRKWLQWRKRPINGRHYSRSDILLSSAKEVGTKSKYGPQQARTQSQNSSDYQKWWRTNSTPG